VVRSLVLTAGCVLVACGCGGDESDDGGTGATARVAERTSGDYAFVTT
jgi:UDP-N-acetylmuramyl tripeptide synthase